AVGESLGLCVIRSRKEHTSVMRVDQPQQFVELVFDVSVSSKNDGRAPATQRELDSKVDQQLVCTKRTSGLEREHHASLTEIPLHIPVQPFGVAFGWRS